MPQSVARVRGSGFTVLYFNAQAITYLEAISDSGQTTIGRVEAIQPLDAEHPVEFAIPKALGPGVLSFSIREQWSKPVWQQIPAFAAANDLLDVFKIMAAADQPMTAQTIIKIPTGTQWRTKTYHNVVITNIDDTDSIEISQMTDTKTITCSYAYATREFVPNPNA